MSFLKDDTILAKLLADSNLFEELLKNAQLVNPLHDLAVKMVQNLNNQINLSSQTTGAEIFVRDLKSLPDFIFYLFYHNVLFNGEKIVADMAPINLKDKYVPFQNKFVYKDGIEHFLNNLRDNANNTGNQLMSAMVGRLIVEANNKLHINVASFDEDTDTHDDVGFDEIPSTINLDQSIDRLMSEKGDFKLLAKHLRTEDGFNIIKQHFLIKKNGNTSSLEDHNNLCSFLNYLYNRAIKSGNSVYKQSVIELGQKNQCDLFDYNNHTDGASENQAPTNTTKPGDSPVETATYQTSTPAQKQKMTDDVLSNLPFIKGGIDIRRMETFIEKIKNFLDIGGAISEANRNTVAQISLSFTNSKSQWISNLPQQIGGSYANGPSDFDADDIEAQNKMINDFGHYPDVITCSIFLRSMVKDCLDVLSIIGRDARLRNIIGSINEQISIGNAYYQALSTLIGNAKTLAAEALK